MIPFLCSSVGLPQEKQLEVWRGWHDTVFDVTVDDPREGFAATSKGWDFGGFGLSWFEAPKLRSWRTRDLIRRNPVDHWIITIGRQRTVGQAGKQESLDVPAGAPFVASLGREILSVRGEDLREQIYLPRDSFPALAAVLDGAEGRPLGGPMGMLFADFLRLLLRDAATFSEANLPALRSAIQGMVLACFAPSREHSASGAAAIATTRRETVRRIVDANLRNASLGAEFLCREAGMSRSQLYRLLENEGGVTRYIQLRRLRQSMAELSDPENSRSVSALARVLCFEDPSSFSRAFKKAFGLSPMETRQAALSGASRSVPREIRSDSEARNLYGFLSQIARG